MPVGNVPISVDQYAGFSQTYFFLQQGGAAPVNLAGYTATMMAKNQPTDPSTAALINISTTPNAQGSIVLTAMTGAVQINILHGATSVLVPGSVLGYDVLLQPPGGLEPIDFMKGPLFVVAGNVH